MAPKEQQVEVDVRNNLNEEIIVHWIENGEKKSITIPANDRGVAMVTKGDQPIRMQAATKKVGRPVYINGQNFFTLDDSQPSGENRVFVLTGKGKYRNISEPIPSIHFGKISVLNNGWGLCHHHTRLKKNIIEYYLRW